MGPFVFPDLDPVAIQIGPLAIRWYALAYIAGLIGGWQYCLRLAKRPPNVVTPKQLSKEQKELLRQLAESMGSDVKPQEDRGFMGKIKDALG